jgi:hypothetical protein
MSWFATMLHHASSSCFALWPDRTYEASLCWRRQPSLCGSPRRRTPKTESTALQVEDALKARCSFPRSPNSPLVAHRTLPRVTAVPVDESTPTYSHIHKIGIRKPSSDCRQRLRMIVGRREHVERIEDRPLPKL